MHGQPHVSVVIPCFNEEKNVGSGVLVGIDAYLSKYPYSYEVIIVDDGSTDKSRELIKEFIHKKPRYTLIANPHQGKAQTVTTGVLKAVGTYILFTDFDQATPITELDKLLPFFPEYDIVIGSRNTTRKGAPFSRILMARGFMMLRNSILNLGIGDTQCGFKAFKKQIAHTIFKKLKYYRLRRSVVGSNVTAGFDVELLYIARKLGFSIKEVPVTWRYVETRRVNPIRDSWGGLKDLFRIKLADLRGAYD